ncbi:13662_t:CDS:2, partial [Dentiscutata erythropus]
NNLEYQVEERIIYFVDSDSVVTRKYITFFKIAKSMLLEYTSISYEKYDEILDKSVVELAECKTAFRSIRHFGKKLLT